jgi:ubiquinone/menaquinone biosynthesis C-methylase UbiE
MSTTMDHLTSATLKHLRESWWDDEFTEFLAETLRPRAGNRILDVGCGEGYGEVAIGRLHVSQLKLAGVDLKIGKVRTATQETASHNQRVWYAAADACRLPFVDGVFDSTFCVAVLQHIRDVDAAVRELARVTAGGGRVVAVEPDNAGRYFYSSTPWGKRAAQVAAQFFTALSTARGDGTDPAIGPKLPGIFARYNVEPLEVRMFPVSRTQLGVPTPEMWQDRRARLEQAVAQATTEDVKALGREYLVLFDAYRSEAQQAGASFVEIQNTILFATVGQKL